MAKDKQNRDEHIEEARRNYSALRAGVGNAANQVDRIRECLGRASVGSEVLDPTGRRNAVDIERELSDLHSESLLKYRKNWRAVDVEVMDPDNPQVTER